MLLGISVWNGRVSPVFDTASHLLLVEVGKENERARRQHDLPEVLPALRAKRLSELGVEVLICGGISRALAMMLAATGIKVVPWVAGPVEEVLAAYLSGDLSHPRWRMPGCGDGWRQGGAGWCRRGPRWAGGKGDPGRSS